MFGISSSAAAGTDPEGDPEAAVFFGQVDSTMFASAESDQGTATRQLAIRFGEFLVPTPGQREYGVNEDGTVDGRPTWRAGYLIRPTDSATPPIYVQARTFDDAGRRLYAIFHRSARRRTYRAEGRAVIESVRFD